VTVRHARIGIIGAGWWATQVYIPAILGNRRAELVAINRRDPTALARILDAFPGPRGYRDYREMIAAEALDGVIVGSPHTLHHEHAGAVIDAGCHVLIDKPMTTSAATARDLVERADRAGVGIAIPYGWNFTPFVDTAAQAIRAGRIGEPRHILCHLASATFDLFSGAGLSNAANHMFQPQASTWADPDQAGGYGWGQLSHALGLLFRLVDLRPVQVAAMRTTSPTGVDLCDAAILRFACGAQASLSGTALLPKHATRQLDVRIHGTEGALFLDMERARMDLRRFDGDDLVLDLPAGAGAYDTAQAVARFCEMCAGGPAVTEASGLIGLRSVEVLDAMYRAFRSGRAEAVWPDANKGRT
jgi:predicted dehydrogenase